MTNVLTDQLRRDYDGVLSKLCGKTTWAKMQELMAEMKSQPKGSANYILMDNAALYLTYKACINKPDLVDECQKFVDKIYENNDKLNNL